MTTLPPIDKGTITIPPGPGLGLKLQPDVLARPGVRVMRTTAADL
jgi:hypothetical protein